MQQVARFSDLYQADVAASFLAAHGLQAGWMAASVLLTVLSFAGRDAERGL